MSFKVLEHHTGGSGVVAAGEVRDMASAAEHEVAVNFVAHHYNAGLTAYRGELGKRVSRLH